MRNSATSKVIGKETTVLVSRWMHHSSSRRSSCSRFKDNIISLGTLQGEGFSFNSENKLLTVSKEAHVKFQAERVGNVHILRNSKVTFGGWQLSLLRKWQLWNNRKL